MFLNETMRMLCHVMPLQGSSRLIPTQILLKLVLVIRLLHHDLFDGVNVTNIANISPIQSAQAPPCLSLGAEFSRYQPLETCPRAATDLVELIFG